MQEQLIELNLSLIYKHKYNYNYKQPYTNKYFYSMKIELLYFDYYLTILFFLKQKNSIFKGKKSKKKNILVGHSMLRC